MSTSSIPSLRPDEFTAEAYLWLSRQHLHKSRNAVATEELVKATDNLAEALHCAIKAIAVKRDWSFDSKAMLSVVVSQLAVELRDSPDVDILQMGRAAGEKHSETFYEDSLYEDPILHGIDCVVAFQETIERLVNEPPKPFTVTRDPDSHRIAQLTGYEPAVGSTDALGFANFTGELREG